MTTSAFFVQFAATALLGAMLTTAASAQMGIEREHGRDRQPERIVFTVDVAEDFALFKPTLVRPTDTQPERGSFFVTEGNIYPAGTIQGNGAAFDPNTDGAIGRWFCRGTHLVSASEIPAAAVWVDTAQIYLLPRDTASIATARRRRWWNGRAHRHRRHWPAARLRWRTAPGVPGLQSDGRRQSARHVRAEEGDELTQPRATAPSAFLPASLPVFRPCRGSR